MRLKLSKQRKAQIRMTENILVIIIFSFILVFGIAFFTVYQKATAGGKHSEREEKAASSVLAKVMALPEVKCLRGTGQEEVNCLDLFKVSVLNKSAVSPTSEFIDHFYDIMLESKITVTPINPVYVGRQPITMFTIYNNPPKDIKRADMIRQKMPVFLYDPIKDENYYAILQVDYYYVR